MRLDDTAGFSARAGAMAMATKSGVLEHMAGPHFARLLQSTLQACNLESRSFCHIKLLLSNSPSTRSGLERGQGGSYLAVTVVELSRHEEWFGKRPGRELFSRSSSYCCQTLQGLERSQGAIYPATSNYCRFKLWGRGRGAIIADILPHQITAIHETNSWHM